MKTVTATKTEAPRELKKWLWQLLVDSGIDGETMTWGEEGFMLEFSADIARHGKAHIYSPWSRHETINICIMWNKSTYSTNQVLWNLLGTYMYTILTKIITYTISCYIDVRLHIHSKALCNRHRYYNTSLHKKISLKRNLADVGMAQGNHWLTKYINKECHTITCPFTL